jgi:hypothetical protein
MTQRSGALIVAPPFACRAACLPRLLVSSLDSMSELATQSPSTCSAYFHVAHIAVLVDILPTTPHPCTDNPTAGNPFLKEPSRSPSRVEGCPRTACCSLSRLPHSFHHFSGFSSITMSATKTRVPSVISTSLLAVSIVFPVLSLFSVFLRWTARRKTKAGWRLDDWIILVTWVSLEDTLIGLVSTHDD